MDAIENGCHREWINRIPCHTASTVSMDSLTSFQDTLFYIFLHTHKYVYPPNTLANMELRHTDTLNYVGIPMTAKGINFKLCAG